MEYGEISNPKIEIEDQKIEVAQAKKSLTRSKIVAVLGSLPIALTGCGNDIDVASAPSTDVSSMISYQTSVQMDKKKVDELMVNKQALTFDGDSPAACIADATFSEEACTEFYEHAKTAHYKVAQHYSTTAQCEIEHPSCERVTDDDDNTYYIAKMEGFMAQPVGDAADASMNVEPLYLQNTPQTASGGNGYYGHPVFIPYGAYGHYAYMGGGSANYVTSDHTVMRSYNPSSNVMASKISPPSFRPNAYSASQSAFKISGSSVRVSSLPGIRSGGTSVRSGGFGSAGRAIGGSVG